MNEKDYGKRVAVVTGAGGNPGLGRAYAMLLAERGARVVVNDLGLLAREDAAPDLSAAEQVAAEIRSAGGTAIADSHSVADQTGCEAVVQTAIEEFGRLDIVINNAGVAPAVTFPELSAEAIHAVVDTHLMGHIWMCRAAWPHMVRQGYGRILNVSSFIGVRGNVLHPVYAAAKLGVVGLTLSLAQEGQPHGIAVNAIMPSALTLGRPVAADDLKPELVAPVAAFLSHDSCVFSGRTLVAESGRARELRFFLTEGIDHGTALSIESIDDAVSTVIDESRGSLIPLPTISV